MQRIDRVKCSIRGGATLAGGQAAATTLDASCPDVEYKNILSCSTAFHIIIHSIAHANNRALHKVHFTACAQCSSSSGRSSSPFCAGDRPI